MNKRHQFVFAIAAASLVLAGCGSKSTAAKDAGVGENSGTTLTPKNFVSSITAAQQKARSSHVEMTISASGQKFGASGDTEIGATAEDTTVKMLMDLGSSGMGKLEMRLIGSTFYINLGPMSQNKFAKIDLKDSSNPMVGQYGKFLDQLDPSKQIASFKAAMTDLNKKGAPITIDGVKAQPYEMTLDTSKIADTGGTGASSGVDIPKEVTYTMWVGPDNLPRRLVSELAGSDITVNYSKWGQPVDVKAPSKNEITTVDLTKMFGQLPSA
ncbi:MAG: hypothetical protein ABIR57_01040 [Aeromicrobium sp.]